MGSRSRSKNETVNNVANYSLQGMNEAETVVAGNNNTVYTTDHGAVDGAFEFGGEALNFGKDALKFGNNALDLGADAIEQNGRVVRDSIAANSKLAESSLDRSLDFGGDALNKSFDFGGDVLSEGFDFGNRAINANSDMFKTGFDFAESLVNQNTANSGATTMAIKELAKSVTTGGASDIADQSIKTVYTIGGVAVAVVLGLLLMRGVK